MTGELSFRVKADFIKGENRVARSVLRQSESRLRRLRHLPRFDIARGDHAGMAGAQFGMRQGVLGRHDLRLGGVERTGRRALGALREIEGRLGGVAVGEQGFLAGEGGVGLMHRRLRAGQPGLSRPQIGLLLGRVEPGEHVVRGDMLADIGLALDHPPADTEGQIALNLRPHGPGQGDEAVVGLRLDPLGHHRERRARRLGRFFAAGGERENRQQQCGGARSGQHERSLRPGKFFGAFSCRKDYY